jgi:tetratricopeptide (TPR) repeat protein
MTEAISRRGVSPARAVEHALSLLESDPALAERQAREILKVLPYDARALFIVGAARRRLGDPIAARAVLEAVVQARPNAAFALHELGLVLASLGEGAAAIAMLRQASQAQRESPQGWGVLRRDLDPAAAAAGGNDMPTAVQAVPGGAGLRAALDALCQGRLPEAERMLQHYLDTDPDDAAALHLMGETKARLGQHEAAADLLARCLERAPDLARARHTYALVLAQQHRHAEAIVEVEHLLRDAPGDATYRELLAGCLGFVGDFDRVIAVIEGLLAEPAGRPKLWTLYGQTLRIVGRTEDAVAAFRRAIALDPGTGEAYWSLADLKTTRFTDAEVATMRGQLAAPARATKERVQLHYALGKVLEDAGDWAGSFAQYAQGAALRRRDGSYDADKNAAWIELSKSLFSRAFFAGRGDGGCPDPAPIFIVGLPRAGSTLVEQILAGHSQVEATLELPELAFINSRLIRSGASGDGLDYPEVVAALGAAARTALGEEYVSRAGRYRKLGRPRFIDKMPNNFYYTGLIRLILPNARIIDVRRHPMASCFAAFKQHFFIGQDFTYSLADIGRYYRDYAGLMAHFDEVLPGWVHRVIYEDLVEDTEAEIRRLLDFCGLPFEPACLRFWEGGRAVSTHSSQQVRRPIFRDSLALWRKYEPWLEPLRSALGPTLQTWRGGRDRR